MAEKIPGIKEVEFDGMRTTAGKIRAELPQTCQLAINVAGLPDDMPVTVSKKQFMEAKSKPAPTPPPK